MEHTDILKANYILFKRMKELAEQQEKVISDDKMDEFNRLLEQREHIRNEITASSGQIAADLKNIPHKRQNQNVESISMEISDIIRSIQETDKRIEGLIISKKETLLNDIKNIRKGQSAVKGYGGARQKINRFLDRKG